MYKFSFFVPEFYLQKVLDSLFEVGLGKTLKYEQACFISKGIFQFRPKYESEAYIGKTRGLYKNQEYKVEMLCPEGLLEKAKEVLKKNHPYEEPAFEIFKIEHLLIYVEIYFLFFSGSKFFVF